MDKPRKKDKLDMNIAIGGIGLAQKALFAKHLSVMLRSGIAITESLSIISDSTQGKFKKIVRGILQSLQSGQSLSSSFARFPKVFSGLFVSATRAGESSGTLEENLEYIAEQLKKERELVSKVKGAMIYPLVVLAAAFVLGAGMSFLVLPKITPLFEGLKMELPLSTRALIWISNVIQNHGISIFIGLFVSAVFFIWLFKQKFTEPLTHWLFLKLPLVKNITRQSNLSRFCRTLGTLLKSGLSIDEALEITRETLGNYYYRKSLEQVAGRVGKGTNLSDNLRAASGLFPSMVTRMVKVGEESGKLEEALFYVAEFYEAEVDVSTKSLATAIEPLLLIAIGLVVGFLALSIISPIYNITGGIR